MAVVTGSILDLTAQSMANREVEIIFQLNAPNTYSVGSSTGRIIPTEPAVIEPASDGSFSVNLAVTDSMVNVGWYNMQVRWLSAEHGSGLIDFPEWRLQVPSAGGNFGELVTGPDGTAGGSNGRIVWVSQTAPENPRKFMLWLEQEPGATPDPYDPRNTGLLKEWQ